ncbi:SDR family NAD(P)-dependent oxidoreductase [Streptomyces antimycoticus]
MRRRVPAEEEDLLDVASDSSRREAVERVLEITGANLSAVLHNAGQTTTGFFEALSGEPCRHILETHLIGAMDLTRRLLPALRNNGSGRIEVISSNVVNVPHPTFSVCAAATWALEGSCEAQVLYPVTVVAQRRCRSRGGERCSMLAGTPV